MTELIDKKRNAVVFGLTSNHVFAVACVMMDLVKYCSEQIDKVVIFHDKISKKDQRLLSLILPCHFVVYDLPINTSAFNSETINYFSKMVFTKFECLRLLEFYQNVLWLDYDIVIQQDISELFRRSPSGIRIMRSGSKVADQLHRKVSDYNMDALGVSTGTFSVYDNLLNYKDLYDFCYKSLENYAPALKLPEQAIFDFMLQEFHLDVDLIPISSYSPHPSDKMNAPSAKIIHAYGQPKFWNGIRNDHWEMNYRKWVNMGGTKNREDELTYKIIKCGKALFSKTKAKLQRIAR